MKGKSKSLPRVTVKFYTVLRDKLGTGNVELTGADVLEVLKKLSSKYGPDFKEEIFDKNGDVHNYYILLLNDKTVDQKNPQKSALKEGDVLHIFPPIAGGQTDISKILKESKTIAVVGLSQNEERPSNVVAKYLKNVGYKIIPVNPGRAKILGEKCYDTLLDISEKIDIVNIFRRSEDIPPLVADAIKINAKVIWMQEGIINEGAASKAKEHGIEIVMDRCILKEHKKLSGDL